ncbi:MAG: MMPL family transporter [Thermoleophilia bacterium]
MHDPPQPPTTRAGWFHRLGGWTARRHRWVLACWAAVALGLGSFAPQLGEQLTPGGFEISGSTSDQARLVVAREFSNVFPTSVTVLVSSDTLTPGQARFDRVVDRAARAAQARGSLVGAVRTPATDPSLAYPDARLVLLDVGLTRNLDESLRDMPALLEAVRSTSTPDVRVEVTGGPSAFDDFNAINERDLRRAELLQAPFVLIALLVFFGSLVAAGVPIVATTVAVLSTFGALFFAARVADMSIYVQNVVPLIGIGVGVDYSLFVASRYRAELRSGRTPADAAAVTTATAGTAIFFSGLTVAVALAGMLAVGVPLFTGFAIGTMSVVAMAVAVGLTLTPALLVLLTPWLSSIDLGRLRRRRPPGRAGSQPDFWIRWADRVMARPWTTVVATSALLLALAAPTLDITVGSSGISALPDSAPSRAAAARLVAAVGPGAASPIEVVLSDAPRSLRRDAAVARLQRALAADPGAAAVLPRATLSRDGRAAAITVLPADREDSPEAAEFARRIRESVVPSVPGLAGIRVDVGGAASQNADFTDTVAGNLPRVILLVMVLTFLVLVVLFRSLLLPLKAVIMTLLSVLASYGVLVMVFQYGWFDSLLGFDHLGHVTDWVPAFLFSILFGLSMDYEVFLLSRVRERKRQGASDAEAVAAGLQQTGRIITAAAGIMIIVFLSFLTNRLIPIKELAFGLAVAVFLDATLVRLLLVPAFMKLAGRWNWWLPARLDRWLPEVGE